MSRGAGTTLVLSLWIDSVFGEPPTRMHPVVGVGNLIWLLSSRSPRNPRPQLVYGAAIVAGVTLLSALGGKVLVGRLRPWPLRMAFEAWLLKTCFAYRALEEAGHSVAVPLATGDITRAREKLGSLVSRDCSGLDEALISAAAIESLAENLSDGFVAPLMAYLVGGLPAALFYRAANTADSMIGYHGEYEYLGKAAANLDDALNFLPARVTAILLLAVSGTNIRESYWALARDHGKTASPNAGWPMATAAGALGVSLRKPGDYCLNESAREPSVKDIHRAISLVRRAALLCVALTVLIAALGKKST